jgi:hypothetical protein
VLVRVLRTCADPFVSQIKTGMGSTPIDGCKPESSDFKGLGERTRSLAGQQYHDLHLAQKQNIFLF